MKIEIVKPERPELKPGQIWRRRNANETYLSVAQTGGTGKIILYSMADMKAYWSAAGGFGHASEENFEYLGDLKVTP